MIMDKYLRFNADTGQTILDTGASTSFIDAKAAGDAISPGARIKARIATAYVDAGGGTIIATLQTCAEATFASPTTLVTGPTRTIAAGAATAAGAEGVVLMDAVIPPGILRYVRMYYTFSAAMDSGAVDAAIVLDTAKTVDKQL
jgi:hypothetical protein